MIYDDDLYIITKSIMYLKEKRRAAKNGWSSRSGFDLDLLIAWTMFTTTDYIGDEDQNDKNCQSWANDDWN